MVSTVQEITEKRLQFIIVPYDQTVVESQAMKVLSIGKDNESDGFGELLPLNKYKSRIACKFCPPLTRRS